MVSSRLHSTQAQFACKFAHSCRYSLIRHTSAYLQEYVRVCRRDVSLLIFRPIRHRVVITWPVTVLTTHDLIISLYVINFISQQSTIVNTSDCSVAKRRVLLQTFVTHILETTTACWDLLVSSRTVHLPET